MDANGVWGPWSETWAFTARGPAHPVDVAVDWRQQTIEIEMSQWEITVGYSYF